MMKETIAGVVFALAVGFAAVLANGEGSEVASTIGYTNKSAKVMAGPYTLHYGESKESIFYLLARGNYNILSCEDHDMAIYQKGRPWLTCQTDHAGTVTNMSLTTSDPQGKPAMTLIDVNADGQWDVKIDLVQQKVFDWHDGMWKPRQNDTTANKSVVPTAANR